MSVTSVAALHSTHRLAILLRQRSSDPAPTPESPGALTWFSEVAPSRFASRMTSYLVALPLASPLQLTLRCRYRCHIAVVHRTSPLLRTPFACVGLCGVGARSIVHVAGCSARQPRGWVSVIVDACPGLTRVVRNAPGGGLPESVPATLVRGGRQWSPLASVITSFHYAFHSVVKTLAAAPSRRTRESRS